MADDVIRVIYRRRMQSGAEARSYGKVFNGIADEYDRHRPSYPDALVDQACETAGVGPGDRVLEVGCGTGQLTRSLVARGLRVTAVEPGQHLLARAREQLRGDVEFVAGRFEDAPLRSAKYSAVFSASAIHWVDPDVGWRKLADVLTGGGTLALLSYFGLDEARSGEDQQAVLAAVASVAPEIAAEWPTYRDLDGTIAGAAQRRKNVSEVWAWLANREIARAYAAGMFEPARLTALPILHEHTAEELNALIATMSYWARLSPAQREALSAKNEVTYRRLGRPIRSSTAACLVTARRTARA